MKQVFCRYLSCAVMVLFIAVNTSATARPHLSRISDASICLDSMETVPEEDDLDPTLVAVDGGCMISEAVISI